MHRTKFNNRRDNKPFRKSHEHKLEDHQYDSGEGTSQPYRSDRKQCAYPKHLKGADIGKFFAEKSKKKYEKFNNIPVKIPDNIRKDLIRLFNELPENNKPKEELPLEEKYNFITDSKFKKNFLQTIHINIHEKLNAFMEYLPSQENNEELNEKFKIDLQTKFQENKRYKNILEFRKKLPSYEKREDILNLVNRNQIVVISGETGCGKTTQIAQFILDDWILNNKGSLCKIICTQPRRISTISVAERVADERGERCGDSVGYQIRLEKILPRAMGSILFCTAGVLLQQLESNPILHGYSHLILDEIHERDIISDFLITILKLIISKRSDLKVILMSATLNADHFSKYFNNSPFLNIPGFTYPVKQYYLEDVLEITHYKFPERRPEPQGYRRHLKRTKEMFNEMKEYEDMILPHVRNLEASGKYSAHTIEQLKNPNAEVLTIELIFELLRHICMNCEEGAVLIFLPGFANISRLYDMINESISFPSDRYLVLPLHSKMATVYQKQIFERPKPGVRKIIIATNIAETSITVDDVVYVIDCGRIKMKNYNVEDNLETLDTEWISLANGRQRKGRAGRVQPGVCYHLFSKAREMLLPQYQLPEVLRSKLDETILKIKILQLGDAKQFLSCMMDVPDTKAIETSLKFLLRLDAIDSDENLTPLGYHLAKLPMDPQNGKMIIMGALFSCLDPILSIAASLAFKDAFLLPLGKEKLVDKKKHELSKGLKSDHFVLMEALRLWESEQQSGRGRRFCYEYFLNEYILKQLNEMKTQFAEYLFEMNFLMSKDPKAKESNENMHNIALIKAVICAGLFPNIAKVRFGNKFPKVRTIEDGNVKIHPSSVNCFENHFESPFLAYHLKLKSTNVFLHDTTMVHPFPLLFFGDKIFFTSEDNNEHVFIDEFIKFKCSWSDAEIIMKLKRKLFDILENLVSHPKMIKWTEESQELLVLKSVTRLITCEFVNRS